MQAADTDPAAEIEEGAWRNVSDIAQTAAARQIRDLLAASDEEAATRVLQQTQARLKQLLAVGS